MVLKNNLKNTKFGRGKELNNNFEYLILFEILKNFDSISISKIFVYENFIFHPCITSQISKNFFILGNV